MYLACSLPTANFNLERDFKKRDLILNIIVFSNSNSDFTLHLFVYFLQIWESPFISDFLY